MKKVHIFVLIFICGCTWNVNVKDKVYTNKETQKLVSKARKLISSGEIKEAISMLTKAVTKKDEPRLLFMLGNCYFLGSQFEKAITCYKKAIDKDPSFIECKKNLARVYFAAKKYRKASKESREIIAKDPRDTKIFFLLGQSYYMSGETTSALEVFNQLLIHRPDDVNVRIWLIRALLGIDSKKAQKVCEESIRVDPTNVMLLELLGRIYIANNNYDKAIDTFETLRFLGKSNTKVLFMLADLYMNQRMYPEAANTYEEAIKGIKPQSDDLLRLAHARWLAQDHRGSLDICKDILKLDPKNYQVYLLMGKILLEIRDEQKALEVFQKVNSIKANVGEAFLGMGQIYLKRRLYIKAMNCFLKASRIKGTKAAGFAGLAEVAFARGRLDDAIKYYQDALSYEPSNKYYYNMLLELQRLKQFQETE